MLKHFLSSFKKLLQGYDFFGRPGIKRVLFIGDPQFITFSIIVIRGSY